MVRLATYRDTSKKWTSERWSSDLTDQEAETLARELFALSGRP